MDCHSKRHPLFKRRHLHLFGTKSKKRHTFCPSTNCSSTSRIASEETVPSTQPRIFNFSNLSQMNIAYRMADLTATADIDINTALTRVTGLDVDFLHARYQEVLTARGHMKQQLEIRRDQPMKTTPVTSLTDKETMTDMSTKANSGHNATMDVSHPSCLSHEVTTTNTINTTDCIVCSKYGSCGITSRFAHKDYLDECMGTIDSLDEDADEDGDNYQQKVMTCYRENYILPVKHTQ